MVDGCVMDGLLMHAGTGRELCWPIPVINYVRRQPLATCQTRRSLEGYWFAAMYELRVASTAITLSPFKGRLIRPLCILTHTIFIPVAYRQRARRRAYMSCERWRHWPVTGRGPLHLAPPHPRSKCYTNRFIRPCCTTTRYRHAQDR